MPAYVMTNANRKIMKERLSLITCTHDTNSPPRDPSNQRMKGKAYYYYYYYFQFLSPSLPSKLCPSVCLL